VTFNFAERKITIPISLSLSLCVWCIRRSFLRCQIPKGFSELGPHRYEGFPPHRGWKIIIIFWIFTKGGSGRTPWFPPATTIFPGLLLLARRRSVREIGDTSYYKYFFSRGAKPRVRKKNIFKSKPEVSGIEREGNRV